MNTTAEQILSFAAARPEGAMLSAKELLHLGNRGAVDRALSRLAGRGRLLRVGRGLYTLPIQTRFGEIPPKTQTIIQALTERTGETIVAHGAAAANRLGLSTQIPMREVFLTSGSSRRLQFGGRVVELRRAPSWLLRAPKSRAGEALRALEWLGPPHVEQTVSSLRGKLTEKEQAELAALRSGAPTWLAQAVSVLGSYG